jgi:OPA family sugar phosphate sensor protein UhpC-like MFS transporter
VVRSGLTTLLRFFATGPDRPPAAAPEALARELATRRSVTFVGITLGYAVFYTTRLNLAVAKKPLLDAGVLSESDLGDIGSLLLLAYAFGKVANGFLADRAHVGRLMGTGLILSAVVNIGFGWTSTVSLFALLWFLNGWCQSLGASPAIVSLTQWFGHKERGTRYSIWSSAHSIGEGLTWVGTGALVTVAGWRWGFLGPGLLCLLVGAALFWVVHDRPQTYGLPPPDRPEAEPAATAPTTAATAERRMLADPRVWLLALAGALFYMARYGVNNWMILYLQTVKGYSLVDAGAQLSLLTLSGLAGTVLVGPLSDLLWRARRGPIVTLYGALLVTALVALYRLPPQSPWLDGVACSACGFALGGLLVVFGGLGVVDICPRGAAGAAVGLVGFCCYLGAAVQDVVSGRLVEAGKSTVAGVVRYDFSAAFAFWVLATVLALLAGAVLWRARPAPEG